MEFAGHLVCLDSNGASLNMLKQVLVVMTLLNEAARFETPMRSSLVRLVMKGFEKRAMKRRACP